LANGSDSEFSLGFWPDFAALDAPLPAGPGFPEGAVVAAVFAGGCSTYNHAAYPPRQTSATNIKIEIALPDDASAPGGSVRVGRTLLVGTAPGSGTARTVDG
jgi:hypothetical protein